MATVFNPKERKGDKELGVLYSDKLRVRKRREWRGVKDTLYDYSRWLYLWSIMVDASMSKGFVKGLLRYRWMSNYLFVPHMLDKFTIGLLSNAEVIGVNQDVLGKQAQKVWEKGDIQIWMKDVEDGKAIGIFNIGADEVTIKLPAAELGIAKGAALRDLWRQKDLSGRNADVFTVPSHGCYLIKAR